jgi:ATP-binding cassette subfamily F protein 2
MHMETDELIYSAGPPGETAKQKRKRLAALKKAEKVAAKALKEGTGDGTVKKVETKKVVRKTNEEEAAQVIEAVSVSGVLTSKADSCDLEISSFSIILYGREMIADTVLQLNYGRRYGLIGHNGSGKTTMLICLAHREVPIPPHIDIWLLSTEARPGERSALQSVIDVVEAEQQRLEALEEELMSEKGPECLELHDVYDRLEKLDPNTFEMRAGTLLFGLGFSQTMVHKATKDMSGGWRMRVSLAQALLVEPHLLLLDEPTNHLDLGACVWLENYLATYEKILVVVSHSQDFLDTVTTNTLELDLDGKLINWKGNYSTFVKTKAEHQVNQTKLFKKEQDDIKHLKKFIASCGTFSNTVKQAQSKQKIIDKMIEAGLTKEPKPDPKYRFEFPKSGKLPLPVMAFKEVGFAWTGRKEDYLYNKLEFGVDLDSRIALVGPNGAGKSTLLKLMTGDVRPTTGDVQKHGQLRISYYNQHSEEQLDLAKSPIEFLMSEFPDGIITESGKKKQPEFEEWRSVCGRFGIRGSYQTEPMETMSDGLKTRVVFCLLALQAPHILLLDEPTNHLDMHCIDSLADAINRFDGGLVLVSHDFRLISQVAKEVWICDRGIHKWDKGIQAYKTKLARDAKKNKYMKQHKDNMHQ